MQVTEKRIRDICRPVIDELAERFAELSGTADDYADYMRRIPDALSAALAVEAGAVGVKPLPWQEKLGFWTAQTDFVACYSVWNVDVGHWECSLLDGKFPTVEAAKAAAQSDYEERIRSALTPASSADNEIIDALLANEPVVFDPATNFIHADDGGAPEHGIRYVPATPASSAVEGEAVATGLMNGPLEEMAGYAPELFAERDQADWWLVRTDMGKVIFHGPDKARADRVAAIHGRTAEPLWSHPAPTPAGEWQPIETAPKDGTHIDVCRVCYGEMERFTDVWWDERKSSWFHWGPDTWGDIGNVKLGIFPSHWLPIPAAPSLSTSAGGGE